jgi:cytochrome c
MVKSLIVVLLLASCTSQKHLVVFSETSGYRHESIPDGAKAITVIGEELGYKVTHTENSADIAELEYEVIVFLSPTLDVMNETEQLYLKAFVEKGGGFVGIHSATNCEYEFDWYIETLVGAKFDFHRAIKSLDVDVIDTSHPSTKHLPHPWTRTDEWYCYDRAPKNVTVLLEIEDDDGRRPIAWCSEVKQGRSFYTGGGHTKESYSDPQFLNHIKGGIEWVSQ